MNLREQLVGLQVIRLMTHAINTDDLNFIEPEQ